MNESHKEAMLAWEKNSLSFIKAVSQIIIIKGEAPSTTPPPRPLAKY